MTRKKLNLAYIVNDSLRKATFNKRKKGFVKKLHELSVLCDTEACAVIYNPFNSNLEVWPSKSEVKNIVERFEVLPKEEQEKKMVNHESFLQQTIAKTIENNNKKMMDNVEKTMKEAMFQILGGKVDNLMLNYRSREDLCKYIDQYLKELYHHRNVIQNQSRFEYGESSSAANAMEPRAIAEVGSFSFSNIDAFNSTKLCKESWASASINSSNERPSHVNPVESNFLSTSTGQQDYYPMMNPVTVNNQHPNLDQRQFGYPIIGQEGIYNPNQNQNHQEEFVDQMMNHHKEVGFYLMEDNNRYYHPNP